MELWIRSQSKMSLVGAENLSMFKLDENWLICKLNSSLDINYRIELGTYETKERALEVLDEIQEKVKQFNIKTDYGCTSNVYEMPKE